MKYAICLLSAILTLTLVAGCGNVEKIDDQTTPATGSGETITSQESVITPSSKISDIITTAHSTVAEIKISKDEAKQIALDRAGVTEAEVRGYEVELDYDDDACRWEYEISFCVGRIEFDLTIDAKTGDVLEFEKDID